MSLLKRNHPALLITPQNILFINGNTLLHLDSLKDLAKIKVSKLDIFIDGFSQDFNMGYLPAVGLLDRHSAVSHKLSRLFQSSLFYGGTYGKQKKYISFQAFGFAPSIKLEEVFCELKRLKVPILRVNSFVFCCAPPLLSYFLKRVRGKFVLWISPFVDGGLRLVFYRQHDIVFERTIPHSIQDAEMNKDLIQTISYIQNEYDCNLADLKILITQNDEHSSHNFVGLSKSMTVYKWGFHELKKIARYKLARKYGLIEAWLIPWCQKHDNSFNMISRSPLQRLIKKQWWYTRGLRLLQSMAVVLSIIVGLNGYQLWSLQTHSQACQDDLSIKKRSFEQMWENLKLPPELNWPEFHQFVVNQQQRRLQDPLIILSYLSSAMNPELLVQEFLWRGYPKAELKLSFHYLGKPGVDKTALFTYVKSTLVETIKNKGITNLSISEHAPQTLEISWP